ncbi:MAG: sulfite exporter TauE/SafE family protein [Alphaproteobacteria bacterium]|nr:sulfite exporter TauE/SafE family protein [Alphaproteobacteria bacterium]
MSFDPTLADLLAVLSGSVVGLTLGVVGGGGSILAVPLLLYVVGVSNPHVAIGTSALAVSANAFANLIAHSRAGNVKWPCAVVFGLSGVTGAFIGSTLGKMIDGQRLLFVFGLVMVAVALAMLRPRQSEGDPSVRITPAIAVRLVGIGLLTGLLAGFFGIGGGFLIVPGIMLGSGMAMLNAVGSSLFSVGVFGLTTASTYAMDGLVDWRVAGLFIAGGILGGLGGLVLAQRLATRKGLLNRLFAGLVMVVAVYVLWRSAGALGA